MCGVVCGVGVVWCGVVWYNEAVDEDAVPLEAQMEHCCSSCGVGFLLQWGQ